MTDWLSDCMYSLKELWSLWQIVNQLTELGRHLCKYVGMNGCVCGERRPPFTLPANGPFFLSTTHVDDADLAVIFLIKFCYRRLCSFHLSFFFLCVCSMSLPTSWRWRRSRINTTEIYCSFWYFKKWWRWWWTAGALFDKLLS